MKYKMKKYSLSVLLVFFSGLLFSQVDYNANGGAFAPWFGPLANLMISIGALLFVVSAIKYYNQMHTGTGNAFENVTNLMGGSIMLLVVGLLVKTIFY